MRIVRVVLLASAVLACNSPRPARAPDDAARSRDAATAPADAAARAPTVANLDAALAAGAAYLWSQQADDGAFRRESYPMFRSGASLTPLALAGLRFVTADGAADPRYQRGVAFIAGLLGPDGSLRADAGVDFVNYTLALGVIVLSTPGNEAHRPARDAMVQLLRARQFNRANGWSPDDVSYGGWSYVPMHPKRPQPLHPASPLAANLSMTLMAAGALALAGATDEDPSLIAARAFVHRCQNVGDPAADGGFVFAPSLPDGNKAGVDDTQPTGFASYGSMTADGARALVRLGKPDPARLRAAGAWLDHNFDAETNPGDFTDAEVVRGDSSYFYWTWSAAHALRDLGMLEVHPEGAAVAWAPALATALLRRQAPDGSWRNPSSEMREDEPIIATSFALAALTLCRDVIAGGYHSHAGWNAQDAGGKKPSRR